MILRGTMVAIVSRMRAKGLGAWRIVETAVLLAGVAASIATTAIRSEAVLTSSWFDVRISAHGSVTLRARAELPHRARYELSQFGLLVIEGGRAPTADGLKSLAEQPFEGEEVPGVGVVLAPRSDSHGHDEGSEPWYDSLRPDVTSLDSDRFLAYLTVANLTADAVDVRIRITISGEEISEDPTLELFDQR